MQLINQKMQFINSFIYPFGGYILLQYVLPLFMPLAINHSQIVIPENHAIYIGVVQIDHQEGDSIAQIQVKVFADDFSNCLQNAFPNGAFFVEQSLCTDRSEAIESYFNQHLQCEINQQTSSLKLKKCQQEQDSYWLAFEMVCPRKWASATVTASFFMELFPTQSNVIQIKSNTQQQFGKTNLENQQYSFPFK